MLPFDSSRFHNAKGEVAVKLLWSTTDRQPSSYITPVATAARHFRPVRLKPYEIGYEVVLVATKVSLLR